MSTIGTIFTVSDNSGVKKILSIQNITRKTHAIKLGDIIIGVIKKMDPQTKFKFSDIVFGIVIRLKKHTTSNKVYNCRFNDNAVVLVDKQVAPIGSRILGSAPESLKEKQSFKLNSVTIDLI